MNLFKDERGISNLIATLILIAVAVVGGAFAYTAFRNQAQSTTTNASLQVQGLDAVNDDTGNTHISITLKNNGTQRLDNVTVKADGTSLSLGLSSVAPGQTVSGSDSTTLDLSAGQEYVVSITASGPNASISKTMTVRVQ